MLRLCSNFHAGSSMSHARRDVVDSQKEPDSRPALRLFAAIRYDPRNGLDLELLCP